MESPGDEDPAETPSTELSPAQEASPEPPDETATAENQQSGSENTERAGQPEPNGADLRNNDVATVVHAERPDAAPKPGSPEDDDATALNEKVIVSPAADKSSVPPPQADAESTRIIPAMPPAAEEPAPAMPPASPQPDGRQPPPFPSGTLPSVPPPASKPTMPTPLSAVGSQSFQPMPPQHPAHLPQAVGPGLQPHMPAQVDRRVVPQVSPKPPYRVSGPFQPSRGRVGLWIVLVLLLAVLAVMLGYAFLGS